jgi:hypothetical protein
MEKVNLLKQYKESEFFSENRKQVTKINTKYNEKVNSTKWSIFSLEEVKDASKKIYIWILL